MLRVTLLTLAAAAANDPITGSCAGQIPTQDEPCSSTTHGTFDAVAKSLKSAAECATYAKEECGDKAIYVTYVAGTAFDISAGTGICSWFAADQCGCYDEKNCGAPKNAAGGEVANSFTGDISELLSESGDGVPVERSGDEPSTGESMEDPNYAAAQQEMMAADSNLPKEPELQLIPSAEDLAEEPEKDMDREMEEALLEPACSAGEIAVRRGEWQCIVFEDGGLSVGSLVGFVIGTMASGGIAAGLVHHKGRKIRGSKEGFDAAEEESDA